MNWANLPLFFGIAVFCFEGNGVVLNLQASMKESKKYSQLLTQVLILVVVMLIVFSCMGYAAFGPATQDMITLNLPSNNLVMFVQLFYSIVR